MGAFVPGRPHATELAAIGDLLEARSGQRICPTRAWRCDVLLAPLMRDVGAESIEALMRRAIAPEGAALADRIVGALLNHETSFFRDHAPIAQAADLLAKLARERPRRRLRVWSAGCASGQEPLSLAIALADRGVDPVRVELLATDVAMSDLHRARRGEYTQFEIQRGLSATHMLRWFEGEDGRWLARPELLARVRFRCHNVIDPPPVDAADLILCRNVLLYFTPEVRAATLARLASALKPGGLLVLGASEAILDGTAGFTPSGEWRGFYVRD